MRGFTMKVLIACEESQAVCKAFRERGHDAYSCDIRDCSGGHPEWHYKADVFEVLEDSSWDLLIGHPPCTYLCIMSACRLFPGRTVDEDRYQKLQEARRFFLRLLNTDRAKMVCIENPTPLKAAALPPCDQVIQPYMFGDPWSKRTCLWLRNLPPLMADVIQAGTQSWVKHVNNSVLRSKTFPGIARAMAEQWGVL